MFRQMGWRILSIFAIAIAISLFAKQCETRMFPKMPLIETFASSGCGACRNFIQSMDTLYPPYIDSMVFIFYVSGISPSDYSERWNFYDGFYGLGGVPWTALNGDDLDHYVAASVMDFAKSELHSEPLSPIGFDLLYYDHDSISIQVYTDSASYAGDWKLFGLVVKDSIDPFFNRVYKQFLTEPTGTLIHIELGEPFHFSVIHELEPDEDFDKLSAVFFLQTPDSTYIANAFHTSMLPRLNYDFAMKQFARRFLIPPGTIYGIPFKLVNWGLNDDIYHLELSSDAPSGWEIYFPFADENILADVSVRAFADTMFDIEVVAPSVGVAYILLTAYSDSIPDRIDTLKFEIIAGGENLLVCDSPNENDSIQYQSALDSIEISYIYWDTGRDGALTNIVPFGFANIIWFCGDDTTDNILGDERLAIQDYLNNGGNLFLSGSGIGRVNETAFIFFRDVLAAHFDGVIDEFDFVRGQGGYPFTGFSSGLCEPTSGENFSGVDSTSGHTVFTYSDDSPAGVAKSAIANSVIIGFPPEHLPNDAFANIVWRCWEFLQIGWSDIADNISQKPAQISMNISPNPFNSSCAITVSDGRGLVRQTLTNIEIYDLRGNVVWERSPDRDNRHREMSPTSHTFIWMPDESISSGIYFIKATIGNQTIIKRAILLK